MTRKFNPPSIFKTADTLIANDDKTKLHLDKQVEEEENSLFRSTRCP